MESSVRTLLVTPALIRHKITYFSIAKAVWEFQSLHGGSLPDSSEHADELEAIANKLLSAADVNKQVATAIPRTLIEYVAFSRDVCSAL